MKAHMYLFFNLLQENCHYNNAISQIVRSFISECKNMEENGLSN